MALTDRPPIARIELTASGSPQWHSWGNPPPAVRDLLERAATTRQLPPTLPDGLWAAVATSPEGRVLALPSSTLTAGLFWTLDQRDDGSPLLLFGASLGHVVQARRGPTSLDGDYVVDFAVFKGDAFASPYAGVGRIPPGYALAWDRPEAEPVRIAWCVPETLPAPDSEGPAARAAYVSAFDKTVDDLVAADEPIVATLSGGLDSSFVVASLARWATPDRPILAFSHAPHPDAPLAPIGLWDPDDSAIAAEMETAYPRLIRVTKVTNLDRVQPLDIAEQAARESWAPLANPANLTWLRLVGEAARDIGATRLFVGQNGNAAFSADHDYAVRFYLARGDLPSVARLVRGAVDDGMPWPLALRRKVAGPMIRPLKTLRERRQSIAYADHVGLAHARPASGASPMLSRDRIIEWARGTGTAGILHMEQSTVTAWADPFTSSKVLSAAASISPEEWARWALPRGLARKLGEGRVPDAIRLRTRRGGQSWDSWFIVHDQRERYLDELAAVATTPCLGGVVDVPLLRSRVEAWPWGSPAGPPPMELGAIDRLLAIAIFARVASERLRERP